MCFLKGLKMNLCSVCLFLSQHGTGRTERFA